MAFTIGSWVDAIARSHQLPGGKGRDLYSGLDEGI